MYFPLRGTSKRHLQPRKGNTFSVWLQNVRTTHLEHNRNFFFLYISWSHMGLPFAWSSNCQLLSFPYGSNCIFRTFTLSPLLSSKFLKKTGDVTASCLHPAICREGDQEQKMFSHQRRSVSESYRSGLKSILWHPEVINTTIWKTGIMGPQRVVLSSPRRWVFTISVTG